LVKYGIYIVQKNQIRVAGVCIESMFSGRSALRLGKVKVARENSFIQ